ncbi:MAG: hypothetical protein RR585_07740, partial [Coprobacillus sp.]
QGLFASQMRGSKKSKTGGAGKIILSLFVVAYIAVVFSSLFGMLFSTLLEPLQLMGIDWLYFAVMAIMVIMLCFIGSVFLVQHEIYEAKDNHMLLAMPIKNRDILLSRVFVILILNYAYEILVAGPAIVVYAMNKPLSIIQIIMFIIVVLTLPLFVLAISSAFGWLMENIMKHVRKKNIVTLVLSLAFFGVYFYAVSSIQDYVTLLIQNGKSIAQAIEGGLFPIYHLGIALENGNIVSLLIYLVCAIIPFVAVMYVLSKSFVKLATSKAKAKKIKYVEKPMEAKSLNKALLIREFRHFTSNAMVMLNGSMGVAFTLVGAGALILYKEDIQMIITTIPQISGYVTPILCMAGVAMGSLNIISASLVSLEGDRLWIIKSLPIPAKNILDTKLALHLILCIPPQILFAVISAVLFEVSFFDAILVVLAPVLFTSLIALFGLVLNLWRPKFDWVNETVCVKQSMPVMITMFSSMGLAFLLVGGYLGLFQQFVSLDMYTYIVLAVALIVDILLYYLLTTWGTKRFQEL